MVGFVFGLQLIFKGSAALLLGFLPVDHCHSASLSFSLESSGLLRALRLPLCIHGRATVLIGTPERCEHQGKRHGRADSAHADHASLPPAAM
ncbi:hypothetical protein D3C77_741820 [compost metagenome]